MTNKLTNKLRNFISYYYEKTFVPARDNYCLDQTDAEETKIRHDEQNGIEKSTELSN